MVTNAFSALRFAYSCFDQYFGISGTNTLSTLSYYSNVSGHYDYPESAPDRILGRGGEGAGELQFPRDSRGIDPKAPEEAPKVQQMVSTQTQRMVSTVEAKDVLKFPEIILPKFDKSMPRTFTINSAILTKARQTNLFINKMGTNSTSDKHLVLLDSGFGGLLCIGEESLPFYKILSRRTGVTVKFIFGAGETISTNKIVTLRGLGDAHVVPGRLACIAGREWLAEKRAIMDFSADKVNMGKFGQFESKPAHILDPSTFGDGKSLGQEKVSQLGETSGAGKGADGVGSHVNVASKCQNQLSTCGSNGEESGRAGARVECDELLLPMNLFTASISSEVDERQLEEAVLKGWLDQITENELEQPEQTEQLAESLVQGESKFTKLNKKNLQDFVLGKPERDESTKLNGGKFVKIFNIKISALRRLHLLRHSPMLQIIKFVRECIPLNLRNSPISEKFLKNCTFWLDKIEKSCVGCALNGTRNANKMAVPRSIRAFAVAMLDIMCLDHSEQLCALAIIDLGSSIPALQLIESTPPTSESVFQSYVEGWAARRGVHQEVICDRDGIFRSFKFLKLLERLGIGKSTTGAGSHESLAQAERLIRTFRWAIDRHRDGRSGSEVQPKTKSDWRFFIAVVENAMRNEETGGSTASLREYGRSSHLLRSTLTDTPASAPEEFYSSNPFPQLVELAESARETWRRSVNDSRLRRLLSNFSIPSHVQGEIFANGTAVSFWRERVGTRNASSRCGPAVVIGFNPQSQRYALEYGSNVVYADRSFCKRWTPSLDPDPTDEHLLDLISQPAVDVKHDTKQTCPKCRNHSSHHAHTKTGSCKLAPSNIEKLATCALVEGAMSEEVYKEVLQYCGCEKSFFNDQLEVEEGLFSAVSLQDPQNGNHQILTDFTDIPIDDEEMLDLEKERSELEAVHECVTVEGQSEKYLLSWEDLSPQAQALGRQKAIEAYDSHDAWDRSSDLNDQDFRNYFQSNRNSKKIIKLGSRWVDVAKVLQDGTVIGKSRLTPKGFDDRSWESLFYSSAPTVSSSSIRISETLGLRANLVGVVIDFSDAFFMGDYLNFADNREIWLNVVDLDNRSVWRRLKKEVPGCKGAAASWYRKLVSVLTAEAGYTESSLDKAWFVKHDPVTGKLIGSIPLHVDDTKGRFTNDEIKRILSIFEKFSVKIGTLIYCNQVASVEFCGITYHEDSDAVTFHQDLYIRNKISVPSKLPKMDENEILPEDALKLYATCVGQLIWILPTQLCVAFEISQLARRRTNATSKDYSRLRVLIMAIRESPQRIRIAKLSDALPLKLIAIVDAGGGELVSPPLKQRDQQCICILIAEGTAPGTPSKAAIIYFSSNGISRVCHASFDMEAVAGVAALDVSLNLRICVGEGLGGICPSFRSKKEREEWESNLPNLEMHSDAMSFVRVIRSGTTHTLNRRRASDVEDMRQQLKARSLSCILHVRGESNPVDCGTKQMSKCQESIRILTDMMTTSIYTPVTENLPKFTPSDSTELMTIIHHLISQ